MQHYKERMRALSVPDSKKNERIVIYFNTFPCLTRDCAVELVIYNKIVFEILNILVILYKIYLQLELDFDQKIAELKEANHELDNIPFKTLFTDNWRVYSEKLIEIYSSSTKKEVQRFYNKNLELFKIGNISFLFYS